MKFFWPIFLSAAVFSTAVMYFAAPLARPYVEAVFGIEATSPQASLARRAGGVPQPDALGLKTLTQEDENRAARTAGSAQPEGLPAAQHLKEAEEDEVAPALQGINLIAHGDRPSWGITNQRATTYALDGSRLSHLPGGVVLAYKDARTSSIGNVVECRAVQNGVTSAPPCLVSRKDVYLFTGPYAALSQRQRDSVQAYYELSGRIGMRKNELLQASADKNPFFAQYSEAHKAFMTHIDAGKALTVKRDRATGPDKSSLEDQLREMKVAETRLRAEYEAAHLKFRTWKDQHANELTRPENDPEIKKMAQEMIELRKRIPGLTP